MGKKFIRIQVNIPYVSLVMNVLISVHEICDNQSHTVTTVKVKGSNEILGWYNLIKWKSDDSWGPHDKGIC